MGCARAYAYVDEVVDHFDRLEPYRPSYAVFGKPDMKIQLSGKTRPLMDVDLYLAYTQKIFWQVFTPSGPFRDVNYNPEVFYRYDVDGGNSRWLDFGIYEHESNGGAKADSRSWDRTYLRFSSSSTVVPGRHALHWSLKAWVPYRVENDNPDLVRYRGRWELSVDFSSLVGAPFERSEVLFLAYPGGATGLVPWQGGQELIFRAKAGAPRFLSTFMVQLFHGYGETLMEYREERFSVRAGVGI